MLCMKLKLKLQRIWLKHFWSLLGNGFVSKADMQDEIRNKISPEHVVNVVHALLSIIWAWEAIIAIWLILKHLAAAGKQNCFHIRHCPPVEPSLDLWESPLHFVNLLIMSWSILFAWLEGCQALGFKESLKTCQMVSHSFPFDLQQWWNYLPAHQPLWLLGFAWLV